MFMVNSYVYVNINVIVNVLNCKNYFFNALDWLKNRNFREIVFIFVSVTIKII